LLPVRPCCHVSGSRPGSWPVPGQPRSCRPGPRRSPGTRSARRARRGRRAAAWPAKRTWSPSRPPCPRPI